MSGWYAHEADGTVDTRFGSDMHARFEVQQPTVWTTPPDSTLIRLHKTEGWIDVVMTKDGGIEIRGAHRLEVQPNAANSITIYLADERVEPGQVTR